MVQYMESGMPQGATCKRFGCRILHNNWTTGGIGKLRRFIDHGFWYYDTDRMMCLHHWDKTDRKSVGEPAYQQLLTSNNYILSCAKIEPYYLNVDAVCFSFRSNYIGCFLTLVYFDHMRATRLLYAFFRDVD